MTMWLLYLTGWSVGTTAGCAGAAVRQGTTYLTCCDVAQLLAWLTAAQHPSCSTGDCCYGNGYVQMLCSSALQLDPRIGAVVLGWDARFTYRSAAPAPPWATTSWQLAANGQSQNLLPLPLLCACVLRALVHPQHSCQHAHLHVGQFVKLGHLALCSRWRSVLRLNRLFR